MSKQILGRGLSSLIPQKNNPSDQTAKNTPANAQPGPGTEANSRPTDFRSLVSEPSKNPKEHVFFVETEKVRPNPHQPRRDFDQEALQDLAESIRRHGIIQPLVVSKNDEVSTRGQDVWYELVAGERRLRAARLAGLKHVPIVIREAHEEQKLEVALVENLQRHNLSPMEEARAFRKLMDIFGLSQQEVALRVGKSRPAVANTMRLLELPQEVQKGLGEGKISEGHARALLGLRDPVQILALYNEVAQKNLSVREVEDMVRMQAVSAGMRKAREPKASDPEVREVQSRLANILGTKVAVKGKTSRGKIVVEFYSREELQTLIDRMSGA